MLFRLLFIKVSLPTVHELIALKCPLSVPTATPLWRWNPDIPCCGRAGNQGPRPQRVLGPPVDTWAEAQRVLGVQSWRVGDAGSKGWESLGYVLEGRARSEVWSLGQWRVSPSAEEPGGGPPVQQTVQESLVAGLGKDCGKQ